MDRQGIGYLAVILLVRAEPDPVPILDAPYLVHHVFHDVFSFTVESPSPWFHEVTLSQEAALTLAHSSPAVGGHLGKLAYHGPMEIGQPTLRRFLSPLVLSFIRGGPRLDVCADHARNGIHDKFQPFWLTLPSTTVGANSAGNGSTPRAVGCRRKPFVIRLARLPLVVQGMPVFSRARQFRERSTFQSIVLQGHEPHEGLCGFPGVDPSYFSFMRYVFYVMRKDLPILHVQTQSHIRGFDLVVLLWKGNPAEVVAQAVRVYELPDTFVISS